MPSTHGYLDDDLVGIGVAAEIAGVHPNTLRRWADARAIPAYRTPGGMRRFRVSDLRDTTRLETEDAAAS